MGCGTSLICARKRNTESKHLVSFSRTGFEGPAGGPCQEVASSDSASSADVAPPSTTFFVTMTVSMPYSKAEFDVAKQDKYKAAVAAAASTSAPNVYIVSVTETTAQRRAGSIDVETKVFVVLLLCHRSAVLNTIYLQW